MHYKAYFVILKKVNNKVLKLTFRIAYMRYIAVIVLFIASVTGAKAKNNISVDYTEESELVSVIAHLAKVPGYVWPKEQAGVIDYFHRVDSTFAPIPIIPS